MSSILIIGQRDACNREKGLRRLQKAFSRGTITKDNINKRGYNKFLEISKDVKVSINEQQVIEDGKWDGLKGYITNTDLSAEDVYKQYRDLWLMEWAYRITKGTLEMRLMFQIKSGKYRQSQEHIGHIENKNYVSYCRKKIWVIIFYLSFR